MVDVQPQTIPRSQSDCIFKDPEGCGQKSDNKSDTLYPVDRVSEDESYINQIPKLSNGFST